MTVPSPRALLVRPALLPDTIRVLLTGWQVADCSLDDLTSADTSSDVVLLPEDLTPCEAARVAQRWGSRGLLCTASVSPACEARAIGLGLAGSLPLDAPAVVAVVLARVLATARRDAIPVPTRWSWEPGCLDPTLDDRLDDAMRAGMLPVLRDAVAEHRDHQVAAFHFERTIVVESQPLRLGVEGTVERDGDGVHAIHGRVAPLRAHAGADAHLDLLTGLPTRASFVAALHADATPGNAVLCVDLDNVTAINDGLGPEIGDQLLRWAATRLRDVFPGRIIARIGSDEFAVLLPAAFAVAEAAHRAITALSSPVVLSGHPLYPSARAGTAIRRGADASVEVLRDARSALAGAKISRARRPVAFDEETRRAHLGRLRLHGELRQAIAHDELTLHFQPIVDVASGRPSGFEALLRWHHPTGRLVTATEFVPHAELHGLIQPMGRLALRRATGALGRLHDAAPDLRGTYVAVNLSPLQLVEPDLLEQVEAALAEAALPPSTLRLELTEHTVTTGDETTLDVLRRIRAMGVQILLDDFGTGYSALQYLVTLPADVVKIDRAFVDGLGVDDRKTRVICTIVDLARSLGMSVVAEGVETQEQLHWVRRLGIESAQGFLLGRPVSEEALTAQLTARREPTPG